MRNRARLLLAVPGVAIVTTSPATAQAATFHLRTSSAITFSMLDSRARFAQSPDADARSLLDLRVAGKGRLAMRRFAWSASRAFADFAARGPSYADLARHVHLERFRLLGINGTTPFPMAAFEIGSKNLLLGNRLAINADVFRYRYGGYRMTLPGARGFNGTAALLPSLGASSRTTGAELQAAYKLTSHDFVGFTASYAHGRRSSLASLAGTGAQFTGVNSLQLVPSIEHIQLLPHGRSLTFDAAAIYRSSARITNPGPGLLVESFDPTVRRSETTRFEASVTYRSGPRFSLTAFVRNITDVRPDKSAALTTRNVVNPATVSAVLSEPRTFGVAVRARL
jgi:hypothetical protein